MNIEGMNNMNFNKIIEDMKCLQEKIDLYTKKEENLNNAISVINKDLSKLEIKKEKETDEINKAILNLRILITKSIINKLNNLEDVCEK